MPRPFMDLPGGIWQVGMGDALEYPKFRTRILFCFQVGILPRMTSTGAVGTPER